jgi:hypothetical protein
MVMLAHLEQDGIERERRRSDRRVLKLRVPGARSSQVGAVVLIHDLSHSGLLIETSADVAIGENLEIELPEAGLCSAKVVWNSGRYFGCEFKSPISRGALSAALLKNPIDPEPGDPPDFSGYQGSDDVYVDKLPLRARFLIIVGLAIASWAVSFVIFGLVKSLIQ